MARRPADYADRRSDGYTEPLELYVLGTSHVSDTSARNVRRVLQAVRPQSVVVEVRCVALLPWCDSKTKRHVFGQLSTRSILPMPRCFRDCHSSCWGALYLSFENRPRGALSCVVYGTLVAAGRMLLQTIQINLMHP